ncbi:MAG: hypothetical protein Q8L55_04125 [Phycisphaerales bacterium]|nr:hypothetical protein [Phycisphaerales bacterium]
MNVPGLGELTLDKQFGWYYSEPLPVKMFSGKLCAVVLEGYDTDERQHEFHTAIANFLAGTPAVLRAADEPLFRYYKDFEDWWLEDGRPPVTSHDELWQLVKFGSEAIFSRRSNGDKGLYVSVECECDWEIEHGLQLVLKNGLKVNKLGGYDGHLTNSDAFTDERLENVIYPTR